MSKRLILIMICGSFSLSLFGQGEIDEQTHLLFSDESTFGTFLTSNGFGLNYRHGFYRNAWNQLIVDADLTYVKHPKEVKIPALIYEYSTRKYVYGKENLFWELKGTMGWQKELYRKYDLNGISVRFFYAGGVSLGFLKPIYYEILDISNGVITNREYVKFETHINLDDIGGRGPFFMGFNELGVVPGITAKTGLSFEYSQRDAIIHALEAGVSLTLYPKKIPIMATDDNNFLFFNLIVGYRFGKIIDISEAARAKSWRERRQERKRAQPSLSSPFF
ncbi:MAG: hypothetical protein ABFS10_01660 [Bacteroidota bacterium]